MVKDVNGPDNQPVKQSAFDCDQQKGGVKMGYANRFQLLIGMLILLLMGTITSGCTSSTQEPTATPPPAATNTPEPTATEAPTDTPEPTATHTATPEPTATNTATPEPTATNTPDLTATAEAEVAAAIAARQDDVVNELQNLGINTTGGELNFVQAEPAELNVVGYNMVVYRPVAFGQTFSDFALGVDVTWDSSSGLAGCSLIFRSEPLIFNVPQYKFNTLRLSGAPVWDVEYWDGRSTTMVTGDIKFSDKIDESALATNHYVLHVEGTTLIIYANGMRLGTTTLIYRDEGAIAFMAQQESGETTCIFENAFVYTLDQ